MREIHGCGTKLVSVPEEFAELGLEVWSPEGVKILGTPSHGLWLWGHVTLPWILVCSAQMPPPRTATIQKQGSRRSCTEA